MRLRHIAGSEDYIKESSDCINNPEEYKGRWSELFKNNNPLRIEIGTGKGQFIRQLALRDKEHNYLGVERYETVLMKAVQRKQRLEEESGRIDNLYFICMDALRLTEVFAKKEVERIYLNFSDPWPKARHEDRRLTSGRFMKLYENVLADDGVVEFKTDNVALFDYSLEAIPAAGWKIIYMTRDLHSEVEAVDNIMTEYEEKFSGKGQSICKLIARKERV